MKSMRRALIIHDKWTSAAKDNRDIVYWSSAVVCNCAFSGTQMWCLVGRMEWNGMKWEMEYKMIKF